MTSIKGVLFDSGDTLVRPLGGAWAPGHRFHEILEARGVRDLAWRRMDDALSKAQTYLIDNHSLTTEDEEREQFQTYYEIVLRELGVEQPDSSLTLELAKASVDELNMEPFPDTHSVVRGLHQAGLRLGILSDTWPSLDRKYRLLGLRDYFDLLVISAQVGLTKPDAKIFMIAIEGMRLPPENILFVDDSPINVRAAIALGLRGVLIARNGEPADEDIPWIGGLSEIEAFL